ncbi:discoidin domain-containing protein [Nonomuraea sp. bgisy101]|uniref:discoidin domain-containing protein n=1 Tax=Nonomuraea sp. bgisy101 TaxID=3413784 RepID=UPI003D70E225
MPRALLLPLVLLAGSLVVPASATASVSATAGSAGASGSLTASAAETLLSQGKPSTASSTESASLGPAGAFDGDLTGTRWASAEGHDPEWIQVDLGAVTPISRVRLTWEAAYARAYQIQTSPDGVSWTAVHSTTSGDGGTDDLTVTGEGRFVRMYGTARGTSYGYSLHEMQVYGDTPGNPGGPEYQAENATLSQATVASNHAGYTGSGFVDYVNTVGGYVEWTVQAATAGPATLTFRYANGTTAVRPLAIAVNGTVANRDFPGTGAWATWSDLTLTATLKAGANTVRATATGAAGGPNLDKLTVGASSGGETFVVAAAGDIAEQCTASSSSCAHPKTANLVKSMNPDFVITMGDNQYDDARLQDFTAYYDKTWGAFKNKTRPSAGNHESYDPAGFEAGYKSYFGPIAFPNGKSYYSYDRGNWHFVALDSNLFDQSAQINWLKADLAATDKRCVAAYWHHPLFSSGEHGNDPVSKPVWQILYERRADLVLNGHDHHYERFAPQNPNAQADPNGIVEVLGGMGGASPYNIENVQPNSQKRLSGTFGVVKLTMGDSTFSSQLIGVDGQVKDTSPTYTCH